MSSGFDDIKSRVDTKFRFVLLAAHRAEQIMRGARPKLDHATGKQTRIAMNEILADVVNWDYGPAPEPEPVEVEMVEAPSAEAAEGIN